MTRQQSADDDKQALFLAALPALPFPQLLALETYLEEALTRTRTAVDDARKYLWRGRAWMLADVVMFVLSVLWGMTTDQPRAAFVHGLAAACAAFAFVRMFQSAEGLWREVQSVARSIRVDLAEVRKEIRQRKGAMT